MEGEREKARDQNEGSGEQQPIGRQGEKEIGRTGQGATADTESVSGGTLGAGQSGGFGNQVIGTPQGSTGNEFGASKGESAFGETAVSGGGQSDLGSQAGATLAGRADQQDLGQDQPGSFAGGVSGRQSKTQGEGFIGQQDTGNDDYLRESGGGDFAEQGQGALDQTTTTGSSDIEGERDRNENRDSDIERGSGDV